jgi:hypothetical protein
MSDAGCSPISCYRIRGIKRSEALHIHIVAICKQKFRSNNNLQKAGTVNKLISFDRCFESCSSVSTSKSATSSRTPMSILLCNLRPWRSSTIPAVLEVLLSSDARRSSRSSRRSAALRPAVSGRSRVCTSCLRKRPVDYSHSISLDGSSTSGGSGGAHGVLGVLLQSICVTSSL